jgi:Bacterial PH domain
MKYYSKKDRRVLLLVWTAILFPLGFGLVAIHIESELGMVIGGWISLVVASIFALSLAFLSFPLYYETTPDALRIRCGLLKQEIPFSSIQAIFPTRNPLAAPAWSLDRLQVNYQAGNKPRCALIAPQDKDVFLRELVERDPGLAVKAGSVLRRY